MCFLAFYAYLRVGEITVSDLKAAGNIIQFSELAMAKDRKNEPFNEALTFYSHKHSFNQRRFTFVIHKSHNFCPVHNLRRCESVELTRHDTKDTVSELKLPLTQHKFVFRMPRFGLWGDGIPTPC